ncbi:3'-5' exoribonuclease, partial [Salmonella enterica subsp. enterica serovar Typhimurium]|nr:3'-5' exoribonuclease [Salmonella enterica subsp. enterica serovar Typhimurium]
RASLPCLWNYRNDHDVRTMVTLGRAIGFDPKRDMPFEGDMHNALADARHQAKYVSAIWQKLIPPTSNNI